jgi:hypothetical protein
MMKMLKFKVNKLKLSRFTGYFSLLFFGLTGIAAELCPMLPDQSSKVMYLKQLSDEGDYRQLIGSSSSGIDFVKFAIDIVDHPAEVIFQNTLKYPFHHEFLKDQLPQFANLSFPEYEQYLFSPTEKRITAGAFYYSKCFQAPGKPTAGMAGFTVYFRDKLPIEEIVSTYQRLSKSVPFMSDRVFFLFERPADFFSPAKRQLAERGVPSLSLSSFINASPKATVYNPGKSFGYLKKMSLADFERGDYTSKDILLLDQVPLDIGPVSGIITLLPQSPHSHIILRAINQKVPDAYLPAWDFNDKVKKYSGQLVRLEVNSDASFNLEGADELGGPEKLLILAQEYFSKRIPVIPAVVPDLKTEKIFELGIDKIIPEMSTIYGAKGSNFALLNGELIQANQDRSYFNGARLIPFFYYQKHISQSLSPEICKKALESCDKDDFLKCQEPYKLCLDKKIEPIISFLETVSGLQWTNEMLKSSELRRSTLAFARGLIIESPLEAGFKKLIYGELGKAFSPNTRIRFRSSTNGEDISGLNGAGFYVSKAGCLADQNKEKNSGSACLTEIERKRTLALIASLENDKSADYTEQIKDMKKSLIKTKTVEKAIRSVYASLWNEKPFLFRDYYRIPHLNINMGILIHRSFVDESANGVALIQNSGSKNDFKVLDADVVVQKDDISITNPIFVNTKPDRFLAQWDVVTGQLITAPKYLSRSNLTNSYLHQGAPASHYIENPSTDFQYNTPVLTENQIQSLLSQLSTVFNAMVKNHKSEHLFDVEFIVLSDGLVVIKQARPLTDSSESEE